MLQKPKVALISVGRIFFDVDHARERLEQTIADLTADFDLRTYPEVLTEPEQADAARAAIFAQGPPDLLIVQYGSFALWSIIDRFLADLHLPVVLWVLPEPEETPERRLRLNSMCGVNLGANYLRLNRYWFKVVYGQPGAAGLASQLARIARAAATRTFLRQAKLGVIGQAPDGFYPWQAQYDRLQERYGIEIVPVPLTAIANSTRELAEETSERLADRFQGAEHIAADQRSKSAAMLPVLRKIVAELGLTALALRCWPELPNELKAMPCWAMSELAAGGVPCACEADIYGAVTQLVQYGLSGATPALMDLVHVDPSSDTMVFWHCGAGPLNLANGPVGAILHPNRKVGVSLDFEIGGDDFTAARIGLDADGEERIGCFYGKQAAMPRHFNGVSLALRMEGDVTARLTAILEAGYEHHFSLISGDIRPELRIFAELIGVPFQEL